jgi:hypothetical protein
MNLPDLRILPLEALVPHEKTDPRRVSPLVERLSTESVLSNPPIVAPFNGPAAASADKRFVVLDGANRTSAFRELGMPHIVTQVVNYDAVELRVWHHVITQCSMEDLMQAIHRIAPIRIREVDLMSARAALARREALAFISCEDNSKTDIVLGGSDLITRTDLLNQLVDTYESCSKVQRTTSDNLLEARKSYPAASAVVVFPRYEPAEIIELARTGVRVPAGITRHVLPLRALRLNYPLEILRGPQPISQKQAHLDEWIYERVQNRRVRTYTEPTVLFDE